MEVIVARKKTVSQVSKKPVVDELDGTMQTSDCDILKCDHTHAGVKYAAGTAVEKLNPSEATLGFMKERGII